MESETNQVSANQLENEMWFDCQFSKDCNFIGSDLGMSASIEKHKNECIFWNPINTESSLTKQPPKKRITNNDDNPTFSKTLSSSSSLDAKIKSIFCDSLLDSSHMNEKN